MSTIAAPLQRPGAKAPASAGAARPGLLLQRKCSCGSPAPSLTGQCRACSSEKLVQTKLAIGASNDPLEQEADRIADQVMHGPAHPMLTSRSPSIQRYAEQGATGTDSAPESVARVLADPGRPLEPALREDMEQRFGHDFSRVRVHTGLAAEESARDVNAKAYTVNHNVVFGAGQLAPRTPIGQRLLAHELAHVVQQDMRSPGDSALRLQRAPVDNRLSPRDRQVACVVRLGGCASGTYSRDGGTANEHIPDYNKSCREKEGTGYSGDVWPTPEECSNPPKEPLPTGAKILLGALVVVGTGVAIAATVVAAEAIIPIVIASAVEAGTAGYAFYLANAFVVNEVGLLAAGLLMSCEGDVLGLVRALATDPEQAAKILAEVYILHTSISVNNRPPQPATIPVRLLPAGAQTNPKQIKFQSVGPAHFEDGKGTASGSTPATAKSNPQAAKGVSATPKTAAAAAPESTAPNPAKTTPKPLVVLPPGVSTGEADEAAALKPSRPNADLLGEKAGGYDATSGGKKIINSERVTKDKAGNPIIVRDITISQPDDAIQIKTITQLDKYGRPSTKPLPQLVADNVSAALKKAYNQPKTRARARTPLPGTNIYERADVDAPKKITIIVQVPGEVSNEMREAAAKVLKADTSVDELPPIEVIVQTRQVADK